MRTKVGGKVLKDRKVSNITIRLTPNEKEDIYRMCDLLSIKNKSEYIIKVLNRHLKKEVLEKGLEEKNLKQTEITQFNF